MFKSKSNSGETPWWFLFTATFIKLMNVLWCYYSDKKVSALKVLVTTIDALGHFSTA